MKLYISGEDISDELLRRATINYTFPITPIATVLHGNLQSIKNLFEQFSTLWDECR